jgi:hypothetical protein
MWATRHAAKRHVVLDASNVAKGRSGITRRWKRIALALSAFPPESAGALAGEKKVGPVIDHTDQQFRLR